MNSTQSPERDYGSGRLAVWIPIIIGILGAIGGGGAWLYGEFKSGQAERAKHEQTNTRLVGHLEAAKGVNAQAAHAVAYQKANFPWHGVGVIEAYIYRARENHGEGSEAEYAGLKNLAALDRQMVANYEAYLPCAITPRYKTYGAELQRYVNVFVQRVETAPAMAKASEPIPVYDTFPTEYPSALEAEIAARKPYREGLPVVCDAATDR